MEMRHAEASEDDQLAKGEPHTGVREESGIKVVPATGVDASPVFCKTAVPLRKASQEAGTQGPECSTRIW